MGEVLETDKIIVFLDNDQNRAALLYQRMNKRDQERTFWVKTVVEAIDVLKEYKHRLDIVSLGYNLKGYEISVHPASEESGMEVIRWLEKQPIEVYSHVKFVIHTWDVPIGIKMTNRLKEKGYNVIRVPFGS